MTSTTSCPENQITECGYGLTEDEVRRKIGVDRWDEFLKWFYGQTYALCARHGAAYDQWDVEKFLEFRPAK